MASSAHVNSLVRLIRSSGIVVRPGNVHSYKHMGATLADAVLQAGLNYNAVVRPRVLRFLQKFPEATTTSKVLDYVHALGAEQLLNWKDSEKPARFVAVANFFYVRSVETEECLKGWLQKTDTDSQSELRQVRGIGPKTVDYLKMLVCLPAVAVDRHIKLFVKQS